MKQEIFKENKEVRFSQGLINTTKEIPAEAEIVSHQLMLRAGMIKKLAAGVYMYLPLGYRVIRKIEKIIREEMNRAGALEVHLPVLCPVGAMAGKRAMVPVRAGADARA